MNLLYIKPTMKILTKAGLLISALTIYMTAPAIAQRVTGGITLGMSSSTIKLSDMHSAAHAYESGQNIRGFEGGFFGRVHFGPFYVKPMALVSYQAGQVNFNNVNDGTVHADNFRAGKFEVPLMFGIKLLGPLRIEAGPVYNWVFVARNDAGDIQAAPGGIGYRAGASLEFWKLNLGAAYQGITNKSAGTTTYEIPSELIFTLGVRLGK